MGRGLEKVSEASMRGVKSVLRGWNVADEGRGS